MTYVRLHWETVLNSICQVFFFFTKKSEFQNLTILTKLKFIFLNLLSLSSICCHSFCLLSLKCKCPVNMQK